MNFLFKTITWLTEQDYNENKQNLTRYLILKVLLIFYCPLMISSPVHIHILIYVLFPFLFEKPNNILQSVVLFFPTVALSSLLPFLLSSSEYFYFWFLSISSSLDETFGILYLSSLFPTPNSVFLISYFCHLFRCNQYRETSEVLWVQVQTPAIQGLWHWSEPHDLFGFPCL